MKNPIRLLLLTLTFAFPCFAADLELSDGRILKGFKIIDSDPVSVIVLHSEGVENIDFELCPLDVQATYEYNPAAAEEHRKMVALQKVEAERKKLEAEEKEAERVASLLEARQSKQSKPKERQPSRKWRIVGTVLSVTEEGFLVLIDDGENISYNTRYLQKPSKPQGRDDGPLRMGLQKEYERTLEIWEEHLAKRMSEIVREDVVYIYDYPYDSSVVDGDFVDLHVQPTGRYQYEAVSGAGKTVTKYQYLSFTPYVR